MEEEISTGKSVRKVEDEKNWEHNHCLLFTSGNSEEYVRFCSGDML